MKPIQTFESFLNEGKLELNKTIPTSTKQYTWIYQTGKDSSKTAVEINKKLNGMGITSFISKTTGDTIAIPTGDLEKAFDEVISAYDNMKQFAYTDGTKINKKIVNEQTLAFESFLNEGKYTLQSVDDATVEEFEKDWNRGSKVSGLIKLIKAATGKDISDIPEKAVEEFDKIVGGGIKASPAAIKILDVLSKYA